MRVTDLLIVADLRACSTAQFSTWQGPKKDRARQGKQKCRWRPNHRQQWGWERRKSQARGEVPLGVGKVDKPAG